MRPLVSMATDRVTVGKTVLSHFLKSFLFLFCFDCGLTSRPKVFDRIHFILAGNNDIHKSLNEFEIWRDPTMDCGVGCP